jgi:hypothetical protein
VADFCHGKAAQKIGHSQSTLFKPIAQLSRGSITLQSTDEESIYSEGVSGFTPREEERSSLTMYTESSPKARIYHTNHFHAFLKVIHRFTLEVMK